MNKLKLAAVALAAYLVADYFAIQRANHLIRQNEDSFDKESVDLALKWFATGVECGRADTVRNCESGDRCSSTDTPTQES